MKEPVLEINTDNKISNKNPVELEKPTTTTTTTTMTTTTTAKSTTTDQVVAKKASNTNISTLEAATTASRVKSPPTPNTAASTATTGKNLLPAVSAALGVTSVMKTLNRVSVSSSNSKISKSSTEEIGSSTRNANSNAAVVCSAPTATKSISHKVKFCPLTLNYKFNCYVSHLDSPLLFWIQPKALAKDLIRLEKKLK